MDKKLDLLLGSAVDVLNNKSFPFLCLFFSAVMVHQSKNLFSHYCFPNKPVQPNHPGSTRWCLLVNNPCSLQGFIGTAKCLPNQIHQCHQVVGALYESGTWIHTDLSQRLLLRVHINLFVSWYRWSNNGWQTGCLKSRTNASWKSDSWSKESTGLIV